MIVGIDPGVSGGLAWVGDHQLCGTEPLPYIEGRGIAVERIRTFILQAAHVCIEQVGVRPGQSVQATRTSCVNFGRLVGICEGLSRPYTIVTPQAWRKALGLPKEKDRKKLKAASIDLAQRLFPTVSLVPDGCRVPHDGMAEALLLAEYARRTLNGATQ